MKGEGREFAQPKITLRGVRKYLLTEALGARVDLRGPETEQSKHERQNGEGGEVKFFHIPVFDLSARHVFFHKVRHTARRLAVRNLLSNPFFESF